jgi:hypothetical protein
MLLGLLLPFCSAYAQTAPSPDVFLGYPLGTHFTPHHRVVEYFKTVAAAAPDRVVVEQYGTTYEGRPLVMACIASPANLRRLESIRLNNLRLAGVLHDSVAPDEHAPVIVWLSYNVHGNEPASTEAAMKTLYALVDPAAVQGKDWLDHTVVIIDPCINPDGRDRYVNWYNDVVGAQPNPDPASREHQEPWPRGRTNHYNFDLNRDWAWQTQVETQQRLKKYNSWLPQVHVDYHEQGFNNPYYFAPAAEPYHDVITGWQREFQVTIGKNNARYFDRNGWLYFTKEEFDLFYPSYGDTYPIYNGAIGMTFEQGGIGAGLEVQQSDGDTLTLTQRIEHHYTTGISTIEMAAANSDRLVREFHHYFIEAVTHPGGEFKAIILRNDTFGDRLERMRGFLDRNGIKWGLAAGGTYTGVDYETGKTATFRAAPGDIVINANQPKSNLLRVLFERQSHISDSVTYDITAWSAPFAYGVQAYGLPAYAGVQAGGPKPVVEDRGGQYAYAIRWTGMGSIRLLSQLLQQGVKIRYAERPFQSGGVSFDRGTLLITETGNAALGAALWTTVKAVAGKNGVTLFPIASGFVEKGPDFGSGLVRFIRRPRVALLTGDQVGSQEAGEIWHLFEQEIGYPITLVNAESMSRVTWKNYDVVILPGGRYRGLDDKNTSDVLRNWVQEGGRLIAMEQAVEQLARGEWGIKAKGADAEKKEGEKEKKDDEYADLHRYDNRQREEVAASVPGSIYKVELDNSHPLAFGYPDHYYSLKQDDNVYEFMKDGGWNVGVVRKDGYVSGFTGVRAREKIRDGVIFGVQELGRGEVVFMADDPLFRSFWENGKLLFCNAVFLVGQ